MHMEMVHFQLGSFELVDHSSKDQQWVHSSMKSMQLELVRSRYILQSGVHSSSILGMGMAQQLRHMIQFLHCMSRVQQLVLHSNLTRLERMARMRDKIWLRVRRKSIG